MSLYRTSTQRSGRRDSLPVLIAYIFVGIAIVACILMMAQFYINVFQFFTQGTT